VCLHFKVTTSNHVLAMFDKTALQFLYTKNGVPATQQTLDGVDVISEFSQLTDAAKALGALSWAGEQTGCTLHIYHGIGDKPHITLRDGTTSKYKTDHHEGGTTDVYYRFYTTDLSAETLGELAVLKNHELDIELTLPEAISAALPGTDDDGDDADAPMSPEKAFSAAVH
jgi:hypothetical protein